MDVTSVTLDEVFAAAHARAASLVPETSGYLALAIADAAARLPFRLDDELVTLTTEGTVQVARGTVVVPPSEATARLRAVLARLLERSVGSMPGLASAARARHESEEGPDTFVRDLEAALVPVNRAAARRALARLARETAKARDAGRLRRRAPRSSAPAPAPSHVAPPTPPAAHLAQEAAAQQLALQQAAAQQLALQQAAAQQVALQQAAAQQQAAQYVVAQDAAARELAARQLAAQQRLAAEHLAAQQALAAQQQADAQALAAHHLAARPTDAPAHDPVSTEALAARLLAGAYAPLPPTVAPTSFAVSAEAQVQEGALFPADGAEPTPTTIGMTVFDEVADPTIVDAPVVEVPVVAAAPRRDAGPRIVLAPELATRRGRGFVSHRVASIEPESRSDVDDLLSRFAPPQSDEQLARALLKVSVGLDPTPPPPPAAPAPKRTEREEPRPARVLPPSATAPVVPVQSGRRGVRVALVALGLLGVGLLGHWLPSWLDGAHAGVDASAR